MTELNLTMLADFVVEAKRHGYAGSGKERVTPYGRILAYSRGKFSYYDIYDGSEIFQGKEVVSLNRVPVWGMIYKGKEIKGVVKHKILTGFLKKALQNIPHEFPFRGPVPEFFDPKFPGLEYSHIIQGDMSDFEKIMTDFAGSELIRKEEENAFELYYRGGLLKK